MRDNNDLGSFRCLGDQPGQGRQQIGMQTGLRLAEDHQLRRPGRQQCRLKAQGSLKIVASRVGASRVRKNTHRHRICRSSHRGMRPRSPRPAHHRNQSLRWLPSQLQGRIHHWQAPASVCRLDASGLMPGCRRGNGRSKRHARIRSWNKSCAPKHTPITTKGQ